MRSLKIINGGKHHEWIEHYNEHNMNENSQACTLELKLSVFNCHPTLVIDHSKLGLQIYAHHGIFSNVLQNT